MGIFLSYRAINMKYLFFLSLAILAISVKSHEEIKCMACGDRTEGPESPYSGICKEKTETVYLKNCGKTLDYHASGCLNVDDTDEPEFSYKGTICFCEESGCNNSFDPNNPTTTPAPGPTTTPGDMTTTAGASRVPACIVFFCAIISLALNFH